ncbi:MAG: DUF2470 domain-containing protein [Planctomycetes bacterium]|nr:DUF2470 domain-containing protein [Planctomycetota bacterium]
MPDPTIESAYAFLRAHTTADIRFDEHVRPIRYVIAPGGALVAPAMVAMLQTMDTVLFVPDVSEGAMEVQVTLEEFDERDAGDESAHPADRPGALADRWRIHHGTPPDVRWAYLHVDAARHETLVIDGEALIRANPLVADEAALCREMNQGRVDDLRRLCLHFASVNVEEPVMVAVDPLGIDVRGRFDVIRVPAPEPMNDADEVRARLATMCATAGDATGA